MRQHPIDESTLIDLAHGLLPPSEQGEALAHIRACPECENRFRVIVADRERSRATGAPRAVWPGGVEKRPGLRHSKGLRWVAAAAVVLTIGVYALQRNTVRPAPIPYWIPVEEEATVLRSSTGLQGEHVDSALDGYLKRNAATAVRELRALEVSPDNATVASLRDLFLASALVNAGQYAEAIKVLDALSIDTLPTQWRRQARWVHYLALMELGRREEAGLLLEELVDEPGEIGRRAKDAAGRGD